MKISYSKNILFLIIKNNERIYFSFAKFLLNKPRVHGCFFFVYPILRNATRINKYIDKNRFLLSTQLKKSWTICSLGKAYLHTYKWAGSSLFRFVLVKLFLISWQHLAKYFNSQRHNKSDYQIIFHAI